ncbi:unnamed protein product [Macrosiphum euphorbiae]|uniref:Uncharacterized protein n=1 Tax=Macrosiphum euphorbiae TaxID=13131 RepID=A0AAV0WM48_9HEMI|nr:unnamed protein product [Macrosiphum euphorbiae]
MCADESHPLQTQIVIKHSSPIDNIKDDKICKTPNVNLLLLDSRKTDDEIVTPNTRALSKSFVSTKSYKSPVDGLRCKMDLYKNRLPKDKDYYGPVLKKDGTQLDYLFGSYYSVTDML